jgi:hypothetical protein
VCLAWPGPRTVKQLVDFEKSKMPESHRKEPLSTSRENYVKVYSMMP